MRMIDANALCAILEAKADMALVPEYKHAFLNVQATVNAMPTIDAEPVRHGRWIRRKSCHTQTGFVDKCSVCQNMLVHLGCKANYCPNCGAKMDGENAHEV